MRRTTIISDKIIYTGFKKLKNLVVNLLTYSAQTLVPSLQFLQISIS
jgi:hypothetical protein